MVRPVLVQVMPPPKGAGLGTNATDAGAIVTAPLKPSRPATEKTYWIVEPEPAGCAVNAGVTVQSWTTRMPPAGRSGPPPLLPRTVKGNVPEPAGAMIVMVVEP